MDKPNPDSISVELSEFINAEAERFTILDRYKFATSFRKIERYYEFLLLIAERNTTASRRFIANAEALRDATPGDAKPNLNARL
jgi:hypothetical protein